MATKFEIPSKLCAVCNRMLRPLEQYEYPAAVCWECHKLLDDERYRCQTELGLSKDMPTQTGLIEIIGRRRND